MTALNVTDRTCAELKPHPNNPRRSDVDAIAESLRTNGQYRPIVTTADGTILAGTHTFHGAVKEGWKSLSCVVLDVDPGSEAAKRIMLADNRLADLGGYDDGALADLLSQLDSASGLAGTGYDEDDLADLLAELEEVAPTEPYVSDAAPAGITTRASFADDEEKYADRATRLIVLPLGKERYAWLAGALGRIADEHLGDSDLTNAEVVVALAAEKLGEEPPADDAAGEE